MYSRYAVIFALILTGYILRRTNFAGDAMFNGLNRIILFFAYPCMIVHNIGTLEMKPALLGQFILIIVLTYVMLVLFGLIARGYAKISKMPRLDSPVAEFAMVAPNDGFMGFPIVLIFFGETGLFFMLAHNVAMNMFLFTYGTHLIKREKSLKMPHTFRSVLMSVGKVVFNPNLISVVIGMVICINGLPLEGSPVDEYLTYIGSITTPMAMIFIGSTLVGRNALEIIKSKTIMLSALFKIILAPLLAILFCLGVSALGSMGLIAIDPVMLKVLVLGVCFPTATYVVIIVSQSNGNEVLAGEILFLSTIVSLVTIPAFITAMNAIF